ncbi:unnamed protein product [Cylindrotheca closterium]|uniref:Uncharacterized protein n=1 Tax=Cylindrotheca closterium TaxID=2856 RepID=A0AAD2FRV0_9STRA|nr:unnamed protein product [Cylindrotheca closterium]
MIFVGWGKRRSGASRRKNFKTLIEQNNATVTFLQRNDFSRALESSILALSCNRTLLAQGGTANDQSSGCLDECMLVLYTAEHQSAAATSNHTFIYDQAIIIRTTEEGIDSTILTAILVFNAALAHHVLGEQNDCHRSRMRLLMRAKQLYELAYESCDLEHNLLFQFALINNIAVIEREIGNVSTANQCFEYLMSLLIFFVDQGCDMRLRHVEGFVANIPLTMKNAPAA